MRNAKGQFMKGYQNPNRPKFQKGNKVRQGLPSWNKGKKDIYSKESLEKMSRAMKGNHNALGCKRSIEYKRKLSEAHRGMKASEETRRKISEALRGKRKGEKCNFWKGGTTILGLQIKNLFEYRRWRSDVFTKDSFTCQECGAKSGNGKAVYLEAHHIKPFAKILEEYHIRIIEQALNCEELWNINNGRTLCEKCHNKTKKWQKKQSHQHRSQ